MGLTIVIEDNKRLVNENIGSSFLVACYSGRVKIAEMLLKKLDKIKINNLIKSASAPNQDGLVLAILGYLESGFKAACIVGHTSIVELMIDKSEREKNDPFPESLKFNLTAKDMCGQIGFHLACVAGHTKVVEMLIDKSESLKLDLKDIQGYTGFQFAVKHGNVDVINLIKSCLII